MSEQGAIRQSELFESHWKPVEIKRVRDTLLLDSDWYKEGTAIWIRPSGQLRLRIAEVDIRCAQRFTEMIVRRPAKNKMFVMCAEVGGDGNMKAVRIPRRLSAEQLLGKPIRVEVVTDVNGGTSYQHEMLSIS